MATVPDAYVELPNGKRLVAGSAKMVEFCERNGLDPHDVPSRDGLEVVGDVIRYRNYDREPDSVDPDGPGLLQVDRSGYGVALTEWRETPLVWVPAGDGA